LFPNEEESTIRKILQKSDYNIDIAAGYLLEYNGDLLISDDIIELSDENSMSPKRVFPTKGFVQGTCIVTFQITRYLHTIIRSSSQKREEKIPV
jgi:hypothetical protein